ncbi:MAG: glycosyltransferase family 2 protein [Bacteroidota bacterium]|nr:glycosyltransferase family 2 protein [Bacteroidota bacterium]
MIKTAIVILNWNGLGWLQRFLGGVVKYSTDPETAIYIADNGSTDGSADWISGSFSEVKIIRFEQNHGFAGGYNLAVKQIEAKYYVLLNSDVEVTEGWLSPLVKFMDQNEEVASCQPKIRSFYTRNSFEYGGAAGGYIDKYGYTFCRGRIFEMIEKDFGQYDTLADIFWSTGACMIVRSEAWKKCGGLDGDFFAHMEEVDLCWRFHNAGLRVVCLPESVVYHAGGGALPYGSEQKTYLNFRNSLYLLYKNLPDKQLRQTILIRGILDGAAAIRFCFLGMVRNVRAIWKAHRDFRKNIQSLKKKRNIVKGEKNSSLILNKSIVFRFYLKGERTFRNLQIQNQS